MARRRGPLRAWQRRWKDSWLAEGTPDARRRRNAWIDTIIFDDGFARLAWPNLHEIRPGIWRGAQPTPGRIRRLAERHGLKTILNLRGETEHGAYLLERAACEDAGIALIDMKLSSRRLPTLEEIRALDEILCRAEKPLLFHCKSGADRSGLVAALYLLLEGGGTPAEARAQLSPRYLHFRGSAAGVLGNLFAAYEDAHAERSIGFRDWLETRYDREALTAAHRGSRLGRTVADRMLGRE
ncbi:tyrosine-protein phosphatase [Rhodobacteraceae bacterium DSL-40]|uniref:fused DSP-PTPase phosphatase/NAD kinase-like protein n=1 Tax=Amaricoccus sp. B4 TaxID=3368557 RepID=UPI000DAEFA9C